MDQFFQQMYGNYRFSDDNDQEDIGDSDSDQFYQDDLQKQYEIDNQTLFNLLPEANPIVSKTINTQNPVKLAYPYLFINLPNMQGPSPENETLANSISNNINSDKIQCNINSQKSGATRDLQSASSKSLLLQNSNPAIAAKTFSMFMDSQNIVFRRTTEVIETPQLLPFAFCNLKKLILERQYNSDPDHPVLCYKLQQTVQNIQLVNHDLLCNVKNAKNSNNESEFGCKCLCICCHQQSGQLLQAKAELDQEELLEMPINSQEPQEKKKSQNLSQQQQQQNADQQSQSPHLQQSQQCICNNKNGLFCYNALQFESRFESGNLSRSSRIGNNEYNLLLQNDINTRGYSQWFFFKVSNGRAGQQVRFNILNFSKSTYLYSQGMKISLFSSKKLLNENIGWYRGGILIRSCKNSILKRDSYYQQAQLQQSTFYPGQGLNNGSTIQGESQQNQYQQQMQQISPNLEQQQIQQQTYYTLSFSHIFEYDDDEVFFAYNPPYTYSELTKFLNDAEADETKRQFFHRRLLCYSMAGNRVELLTITGQLSNPEDYYHRRGVFLTARVHPGEPVGSWMMHGVIEYLLSDKPEAVYLRDHFIFKIIPMLNPDGVIHGNYRCSLVGCDLNRRWKTPIKRLHPEIFYAKQCIMALAQKTNIALVADLHGHSKKKDIFAYGCGSGGDGNNSCSSIQNQQQVREFLYLLSRLHPHFSFKDCTYVIDKYKEGTARVALWREVKVPNIYTIEASFCGPSSTSSHFSLNDLKSMGHQICIASLIYFYVEKGPLNYSLISPMQKTNDPNLQNSKNSNILNANQVKDKEIKGLVSTDEQAHNQDRLTQTLSNLLKQRKQFLEDFYQQPLNQKQNKKQDSLHFQQRRMVNLKNDQQEQDDDDQQSNESESQPSVDNLSEEELSKLLPITKKQDRLNNSKMMYMHQQKLNANSLKQQQSKDKKPVVACKATKIIKSIEQQPIQAQPRRKESYKNSNNDCQHPQNIEAKIECMSRQSSSRNNNKDLMRLSNRLYNFIKSDKITSKKRENRSEELKIAILEPKFINFGNNNNNNQNFSCNPHNKFLQHHMPMTQNSQMESNIGNHNQNSRMRKIKQEIQNRIAAFSCQGIQQESQTSRTQQKANFSNNCSPSKGNQCQNINLASYLNGENAVNNTINKNCKGNLDKMNQIEGQKCLLTDKQPEEQDQYNTVEYFQTESSIHFNDNCLNGNSNLINLQKNNDTNIMAKHIIQNQWHSNNVTNCNADQNTISDYFQRKIIKINQEIQYQQQKNKWLRQQKQYQSLFQYQNQQKGGISQKGCLNTIFKQLTSQRDNKFEKSDLVLPQSSANNNSCQQPQKVESLFYQDLYANSVLTNNFQQQQLNQQKSKSTEQKTSYNSQFKQQQQQKQQGQFLIHHQGNKFILNKQQQYVTLNNFNPMIKQRQELGQTDFTDQAQKDFGQAITDLSNSLIVRNKAIVKPRSAYANRSKSQTGQQNQYCAKKQQRVLVIEENFL